MTQRQNHMVQTVQMPSETLSQLLRDAMNKVDRRTTVVTQQVVHVPQAHVAEKTIEIRQLDVVEKIAETPQTQTIQGTQSL